MYFGLCVVDDVCVVDDDAINVLWGGCGVGDFFREYKNRCSP